VTGLSELTEIDGLSDLEAEELDHGLGVHGTVADDGDGRDRRLFGEADHRQHQAQDHRRPPNGSCIGKPALSAGSDVRGCGGWQVGGGHSAHGVRFSRVAEA
jgi:hypothetical protein